MTCYPNTLQSRQTRIVDTTLPPMAWHELAGWKIMGLRNRLVDFAWERRLGITTTGRVMIDEPDAHFYGTFAYSSIFRILRRLKWNADDVFVDIGCGKGRVVCCAAMLRIKQAMGVDLDAGLCERARENSARMSRTWKKSPIGILHAPAQEVDYVDCTKFFLFHPFGERTLRQVLESIEDSLIRRPRRIDLIYVNPMHDDVLEEASGYERYDQWHWRPWSGLKHDVSFWKRG